MSRMRERSMTMPPSFVERPLMPWPPLRTPNGTVGFSRANAIAEETSSAVVGCSTRPGEPPRM